MEIKKILQKVILLDGRLTAINMPDFAMKVVQKMHRANSAEVHGLHKTGKFHLKNSQELYSLKYPSVPGLQFL